MNKPRWPKLPARDPLRERDLQATLAAMPDRGSSVAFVALEVCLPRQRDRGAEMLRADMELLRANGRIDTWAILLGVAKQLYPGKTWLPEGGHDAETT